MATIILKITEECNARCYYCDVMRKPGIKTSMPSDMLETVFTRINEYLEEDHKNTIQIIWHGGEPLLLSPEYYEGAAKMQEDICSQTSARISHSIQTNLTKLDERHISPLKRLGITAFGTSYDPEPGVRGIGKKINTKLYNERFMDSLALLDRYDIGWGLIYVVTKKSLSNPLNVFHFLCNLTGSGGFNMNPVLIYDEARKDIAITPEEYAAFLGNIFPEWWKHRKRYSQVEPFKSLVDNILHGIPSLGCVDAGDCAFEHVNIAPDGSTSQCGRSADWKLLDYGNIQEHKLSTILADTQRQILHERGNILQKTDCRGCRYWDICHGGCPLDAYSKYQRFDRKTEWCNWKKIFIEEYFEPVTGVSYTPPLANSA